MHDSILADVGEPIPSTSSDPTGGLTFQQAQSVLHRQGHPPLHGPQNGFVIPPHSNGTSMHSPRSNGTVPVNQDHVSEWSYEMRREAQEILPGLFVGPYQASRSLESLKQKGITSIVCIAEKREQNLVKPRFPNDIEYLSLEVRDAQDQNLIQLFPRAKAFIDDALSRGGKVLVHCGDGISRSPAMVTAYVMAVTNMTHDKAFQYVQHRRFCASPNVNFQRQIEAYESIHQAAVAMAEYAKTSIGQQRRSGSPNPRKRRGEEDDDSDNELQDLVGQSTNRSAQRRRADMYEDPPGMSDDQIMS